MRRMTVILVLACTVAIVALAVPRASADKPEPQTEVLGVQPSQPVSRSLMSLKQQIALPGVHGQMDHLAWDAGHHRVFLAAKRNNSIEVMDIQNGARMASFKGLNTPQGLYYDSSAQRLYAACDGYLAALDSNTGRRLFTLAGLPDADNVLVDAPSQRMYLGFGEGGIAIINLRTPTIERIVHLPEHPEFIVMQKNPLRLYANLPDAGAIAVIDPTSGRVVSTWKLPATGNHPMAFDPQAHTLLVGCRAPAELCECDMHSGEVISIVSNICPEADEMFLDPIQGRVYLTGEGGRITVMERRQDRLVSMGDVITSEGARTCLWIAELNKLLVACPETTSTQAEVRVYSPN